MEKTRWVYQYKVNFYDEDEKGHLKLYERDGLIFAIDMIDAIKQLEVTYGKLTNILRLIALTEMVFEFQDNEDNHYLFDYSLKKDEYTKEG